MRTRIILFISFIVVFAISLLIINAYASPDRTTLLPIVEELAIQQIENEQGTFLGEAILSEFQGFGEFKFLSGEKYLGTWDSSQMDGNGDIIFPGIGIYTGEFSNNQRSGLGTFIWDDGDSYNGMWYGDAMHGEGTYIFKNGAIIKGSFTNNEIENGQLIFESDASLHSSETIIYWSLEIINGGFYGDVSFKTSSGLEYYGDFPIANTVIRAAVTYADGNEYSGDLFNGIRTGFGKYTWFSGGATSSYTGEWSNNLMHGEGAYYYTSTRSNAYPRLVGTFENGVPTGTCSYYQKAGFTFNTVWKNGICISVREQ